MDLDKLGKFCCLLKLRYCSLESLDKMMMMMMMIMMMMKVTMTMISSILQ